MRLRHQAGWIGAGILGALIAVWAFPRALPLLAHDWQVSRAEALAIAQERFRDIGEPVQDPYLVVSMPKDQVLERRLALLETRPGELPEGSPATWAIQWQVAAFERGALDTDWTYRARVAFDGTVTELQRRMPPEEELPSIEPAAARRVADRFLQEQGLDPARYREPQVRTVDLQARTDLVLRYRQEGELLGAGIPYGIEVIFAGDRLNGFRSWYEDPDERAVRQSLRGFVLMQQGWLLTPLPLVLLVSAFFLRRYHAGEIGVRRSVQIHLFLLAAVVIFLLLSARTASAAWTTGIFSSQMVAWIAFFQLLLLYFFPIALLSALSWSVGESFCRSRWGGKLAAFDALFQGQWFNDTVARASLRGLVSGILLVATLLLAAVALRPLGATAQASWQLGPWWEASALPGVALAAFALVFAFNFELFGRLLLLPAAVERLGRWGGGLLIAAVTGLLLWPPLALQPLSWAVPLWILAAAVRVVLFLRYGLLTCVITSLTVAAMLPGMAFLMADDPALQFQGFIPLFAASLPLIASARYLGSGRDFVYSYEDIPPHVRRIAERERQKVELETARRIQSSILPELPPELNGVRIAHAYLPATEVGGDFYDVLALEDGRLAVAVGDVAGHGVSSGLVMSMARSALAVQVTFRPDVEEVFSTLNRMVYQSARKRLLTTLCYALVDPRRREILYASAGHLFPYLIAGPGSVHALESISYPLGVRDRIEISVRSSKLEAGDRLFLFSDGVIEAHRPGQDELFGFDRLEKSLDRHAARGVVGIRDGVLSDLEAFTGNAPREDDLTVLVLQVP